MRGARRVTKRARAVDVCRLQSSATLDAELDWFFNLAESEMCAPSNFGRLLASVGRNGERRTLEDQVEAVHAHRRIRGWLLAMPDADAGVVQAAYEPRDWLRGVRHDFGRLAGVAVRLMSSLEEWPEDRRSQLALDAAHARELEATCVQGGSREMKAVRELKDRAELRFAKSLGVYRAVRGTGPSVVRWS